MVNLEQNGEYCLPQLHTYAVPDDVSRIQFFRSRVAKIFSTVMQDEESIFLKDILTHVNEGLPTDALYGTAEATEICQIMTDDDELMISEGIVYKV